MLDRFIYFKDEINQLLNKVNIYNNNINNKNKINLDFFIINEEEWDYLNNIKDILERFRKSILKL